MFKILTKTTPVVFAILATGIYGNSAQAQDRGLINQIKQYGESQSNNIGQVTNVTTEVEHAETSSAFPSVNLGLRCLLTQFPPVCLVEDEAHEDTFIIIASELQ